MKKYYIDSHMTYCYPYETSQKVTEYGVLSKYIGKFFDRNEIDNIICELIMKHPYISHSMSLTIRVMWSDENVSGYYHILDFHNDNADNQRKTSLQIKYEEETKCQKNNGN